MLSDIERDTLRGDRTKPKWGFVFITTRLMMGYVDACRELIVDCQHSGCARLTDVVFVEGGFDWFVAALKPGVVTEMWVSGFDFTEPVMRSLCCVLVRHRPSGVRIGDCGIDDTCAHLLADSFPPSLVRLAMYNDSHGGQIGQTSLLAIVGGVARSSTEKERVKFFVDLELVGVKMGNDCFAAMCEVLPHIKGLAYLKVGGNCLTERGLEAFAKVVNQCRTLVEADFSFNTITSLAPMCAPLRENIVLRELDFCGNIAIGDETVMDLLRALCPLSLIEEIRLGNTGVSYATKRLVRDKLYRLRTHKGKALLTLLSTKAIPGWV